MSDSYDEKLERLRGLLEARYDRLGSWPKVAEGGPQGDEQMRQIVRDGREPPEGTVDSLLRWLDAPTLLENIEPPTPEERDRLANLMERLAAFVRDGSLPEKVWAATTELSPKRRATPEDEPGEDPDSREAAGGNGRPEDD